jgi:hypothetical protein
VRVFTFSSVNVEENTKGITGYPNPSSNYVVLNFESPLIGSSYVVSDHLGRQVTTGKIHSNEMTMDLRNLPTGVYFLNLENGEHILINKSD